jgi:hypothetical protein
MAPRKTPTAQSLFTRINSLPPSEQIALWGMLVTRPGWLGDRINDQARALERGVQRVVRDVVSPMEQALKQRQRKRGPTAATLEYGAEIVRLKDDKNLIWDRVIAALEKEHRDWPQVKACLSAHRSLSAYKRLRGWLEQTRRRYRARPREE